MRIHRLAALSMAALLFTTLLGCQNSPGQVFSPTSDIHVVGLNPANLQPVESTTTSTTGASDVTIPQLNVFFRISNGVSAFIENYQVRYVAGDGQPLANNRFDHAGALSVFLQAAKMGTGTGTGTGTNTGTSASVRGQAAGTGTGSGTGSSQTITTDASGYCTLEVFTAGLYTYMANGTASYTDDISPVIAQVTMGGRDLNDHAIAVTFNITLSTSVLTDESGN